MTPAPSAPQVRAQVEEVRTRYPDERVIGIRIPAGGPAAAEGAPRIGFGAEELAVVRCDSVLAMRERLADLPAAGAPLVVLTDLPPDDLGADLRARLAGGKLFRIDPWQLVKARFGARHVDPRLIERDRERPWIAQAILDTEPEAGYPRAPSGFLEAETVWRHLFETLAGLPRGERDPEAVLEWALEDSPVERMAALPGDETRAGLAAAVEASAGRTARVLFETAGRGGRRALAEGLAAGVLCGAGGDERAARARGRLEARLGLDDLDAPLARAWAAAAERVLRRRRARRPGDPASAAVTVAVLAEADALLRELDVEDLAAGSRMLPASLDQRLAKLARELAAFADGAGSGTPDAPRVRDEDGDAGVTEAGDANPRAARVREGDARPGKRPNSGRAPRAARVREGDGWSYGGQDGAGSGVPASLRAAADAVLDHWLAVDDARRSGGVEMALRLAGWLAGRRAEADGAGEGGTGEGGAGEDRRRGFGAAARAYRAEGSFVDRARARLWDGDPAPPLAAAYARLARRADEVRHAENREFGALLAAWPGTGAHDRALLGVEAVLDRWVAPLAKAHPVLVLVVDAMSLPVFQELEHDLARRGWVELLADDAGPGDPAPPRPTVIAALPTVTEVSRASLLCGRIGSGNAAAEKEGFARHARLREAGAPAAPPLLFHKGDLREPDAAGVAPAVAAAVSDLDRRVVGVVVNAVDDHLVKGDQVRVEWTADRIRPVDDLLELCRAAGRAVVLASDHGHVLERDTELRAGDGPERWRAAGDVPAADEVLIEGPRVAAPGHRLLAPWSDRVRFGMKKNGYHGGAALQEVVLPFGVFAPSDAAARIAGWREAGPELPAWWDWRAGPLPPSAVAPDRGPAFHPPSAPARREARPGETGDLFAMQEPDAPPLPVAPGSSSPPPVAPGSSSPPPVAPGSSSPPPAPGRETWLDRLFAAERFTAQRRRAARTALSDDRIRAILTALDARGGRLTRTALGTVLGVPAFRLDGILSALRRLLNVDGYAVLAVDDASETVTLDRDLLLVQFDLGENRTLR